MCIYIYIYTRILYYLPAGFKGGKLDPKFFDPKYVFMDFLYNNMCLQQ